jgi:hypothetical protein
VGSNPTLSATRAPAGALGFWWEPLCSTDPLTGATDEIVAVHRTLADLVGYELPTERVRPATFPVPTPGDLSDAVGASPVAG